MSMRRRVIVTVEASEDTKGCSRDAQLSYEMGHTFAKTRTFAHDGPDVKNSPRA